MFLRLFLDLLNVYVRHFIFVRGGVWYAGEGAAECRCYLV